MAAPRDDCCDGGGAPKRWWTRRRRGVELTKGSERCGAWGGGNGIWRLGIREEQPQPDADAGRFSAQVLGSRNICGSPLPFCLGPVIRHLCDGSGAD